MKKLPDKTAMLLKIKKRNNQEEAASKKNPSNRKRTALKKNPNSPEPGVTIKRRKTSGMHPVKKKIAGGAAATTVAAGILLSGMFGSPAELTRHNEQNLENRPTVVQMVDMDVEEEESQDDNDQVSVKKKKGLFTRLKERILQLPVIVRAVVGVPLWAVGWGIVTGLDMLWSAAAPAILPIIIKLLLLLLVIFAIVFLVTKAIHPDMPVKKILKKMFRKRNLTWIIISAAVLTAADTVLLSVWDGYDFWRRLVIFIGGLVLLFLIMRPFIRSAIKKQKRQKSKPQPV